MVAMVGVRGACGVVRELGVGVVPHAKVLWGQREVRLSVAQAAQIRTGARDLDTPAIEWC